MDGNSKANTHRLVVALKRQEIQERDVEIEKGYREVNEEERNK